MRLGRGDYLGQPMRLTSFQRRWIWRLYEYYPETGRRRYKRIGLGTGKGNGKTPFEGAVGAAELAGPTAPGDPLVLIAAAALEQSDLVFGDMRSGVTHEDSPLAPFIVPYELSLRLRDAPGEAKRVAAVAGSNDGPRATALLADELHEWLGRLWDVFDILDGAIGKRRDAFTLWISTAGASKKTLLGEQYDRGVAISKGEIVDDETLFEWYQIPETVEVPEKIETEADEAAWLEAIQWANPALAEADFLTVDYIRSRFDGAQALPRYKWLRYHGNRFTRSEELWLPPGAWEALNRRGRPPAGSEIVLGFSGTYNRESAGLVGVTVDRHVFTLDAWEPPEGPAGLTYQVPAGKVDAAVASAMREYRVRKLVGNPNGWGGELETWSERYGGEDVVVEFDWQHQMRRRADACSTFYTAVVTGSMTQDGGPRLDRHLESAETKEQKDGAYIDRGGRDGVPIELAISAVMAFDQVVSLPPPKKPARLYSF